MKHPVDIVLCFIKCSYNLSTSLFPNVCPVVGLAWNLVYNNTVSFVCRPLNLLDIQFVLEIQVWSDIS